VRALTSVIVMRAPLAPRELVPVHDEALVRLR
jgi:hypothetical protein